MNYKSTRGADSNTSFEQVLLSGYCSDGGIFMPSFIPKIDIDVLRGWARLSYIELVKKLMPIYIPNEEISFEELSGWVQYQFHSIDVSNLKQNPLLLIKLEILQSLGGLYDGLAFYPLHWS